MADEPVGYASAPKLRPRIARDASTEDEQLLERPLPVSFQQTDTWRALRILAEFVEGFDAMASVGAGGDGLRVRADCRRHARLRNRPGHRPRSGGGGVSRSSPGAARASWRRPTEGVRRQVACRSAATSSCPTSRARTPYVDLGIDFRYFFARKVMFVKYADAFVIMPGGFGTMDELFEALTLIQTGKVRHFPVILVGTRYWRGLLDWIRGTLVAEGTVNAGDLALFQMTDDPAEVVRLIQASRRGVGPFRLRRPGAHASSDPARSGRCWLRVRVALRHHLATVDTQ